jgi:hypothetical protein
MKHICGLSVDIFEDLFKKKKEKEKGKEKDDSKVYIQ